MHAQITASRRRESVQRRERECRLLRSILMGLAIAGVLAIVVIQIMVGINRGSASATMKEVYSLGNTLDNLESALNNSHDLVSIQRAAERMGFRMAEPDQIRTVTLQDARITKTQQLVDADMNGEQIG